MNVALCKCGVDMTKHDDVDSHEFDASGTRHRCGETLSVDGKQYSCPMPYHHDEHGVDCGGLTGEKLW